MRVHCLHYAALGLWDQGRGGSTGRRNEKVLFDWSGSNLALVFSGLEKWSKAFFFSSWEILWPFRAFALARDSFHWFPEANDTASTGPL